MSEKGRTRRAIVKRRFAFMMLVGITVGAVIIAYLGGCDGSTVKIGYDKAASKLVVVLIEYKAIAPAYNTAAPQSIIYGNGLIVQRENPYSYVAGMAPGTQVESLLQKLQDLDYFSLKSDYKSDKTVAGGTTTTLTVYTTDKTYEVTVEAGAKPAGWDAMIKTVKDAKAGDMTEYNPSKIRLYAEAVSSVPGSAKVEDWPALRDELKNAAAAGSKGFLVEMEEAIADWKAIQGSYEQGNLLDVYWKNNDGQVYTSVYAFPIFPGLPE